MGRARRRRPRSPVVRLTSDPLEPRPKMGVQCSDWGENLCSRSDAALGIPGFCGLHTRAAWLPQSESRARETVTSFNRPPDGSSKGRSRDPGPQTHVPIRKPKESWQEWPSRSSVKIFQTARLRVMGDIDSRPHGVYTQADETTRRSGRRVRIARALPCVSTPDAQHMRTSPRLFVGVAVCKRDVAQACTLLRTRRGVMWSFGRLSTY